MNRKKVLLSSIVLWIFSTLWMYLTCGWLFSWVYELEPKIWLTPLEMGTATNISGSLIVGFVSVLLFVLVYDFFYKCVPYKGWKKGMLYGLIIYLVSAFVGVVGMPFYMTISTTVVFYWLINYFVSYLIMGAIVGAMYNK